MPGSRPWIFYVLVHVSKTSWTTSWTIPCHRNNCSVNSHLFMSPTNRFIPLSENTLHHQGGLPTPPDPLDPGPQARGTGRDGIMIVGPDRPPGLVRPARPRTPCIRLPSIRPVLSPGPEAQGRGSPGGPAGPPQRCTSFPATGGLRERDRRICEATTDAERPKYADPPLRRVLASRSFVLSK